ncbi:MAG: iron-sulfur cluster repair di-iron protein [Bryobacteraceae bacterium]
MSLDADRTVREIAIQNPGSVRVFEEFGIDYCCGGKRPLKEACESANVPLDAVLRRLLAAKEEPEPAGNWAEGSIRALTEHIVEQHHEYVRRESPRLASMLEKVVARHGTDHPEVKSIQQLFATMAEEMSLHMMKEENVLFPYMGKMEAAVSEGRAVPPAMFGSIEVPISRMLADHDDAGELAAQIRALSGNFQAPEGACQTYRGLYQGLEEFERNLHQHVHLENNILFPRTLEMERKESAHAAS